MPYLHHPRTAEIDLIPVLHALADPVRLGIVTALADRTELPCGELDFGISKASMSHHFRVLREAGVTTTRQDGKHRLIALRAADLEQRFPGLIGPLLDAARPSTVG
ncbi:helix-turn-helix domain-containing protein [Kitasatospora sp. NPDC093558]|uniref:ArsR/SmtB family transcription factor n=1 Tax=Kitasatospora sp. NPDC093558 TaxID=3155201 RepID=UPI003441D440